MADYDIKKAFRRMELELIESMIRNLKRHRTEEEEKGFEWSQWQVEQLAALELYKKRNSKKYGTVFADINSRIEELIKIQRDAGAAEQEIEILEALKKGVKLRKSKDVLAPDFFQINDRKLEALIKATMDDMKKAETAILRMANDKYRKIIFDAQMYANSGAGTYEKAVDMATKDFLAAGLNCVEYSNGARHTLSDYADMALRTAGKRAYLQGEGEMRQQWGLSLVILNKRGNPCPKCLPFCGKVLIDDVWSGGKQEDGDYPLMSYAIEQGLYHPRCKDSHTTYFKGISTADDTWTKEELRNIGLNAKKEAKMQYAKRQKDKFECLAEHSLDEENKKRYTAKQDEWNKIIKEQSDNILKKQNFHDVTELWKKDAVVDSDEVVELKEYAIGDNTYVVDGKHVLLDYSDREKEVAEILKEILGGKISLVPRVLEPKGIATPDYFFREEAFDLKELYGSSKNLLYNAVSKKKRQASNFIFDISQCPLKIDEIEKQVEYLYWSKHTAFIDKIIVVKDKEIVKIYERNK